MVVFAKKLNKQWRVSFENYERISGFGPLFQEEIDSGQCDVEEAWSRNIKFLEDVFADVSHVRPPQ
ncbi:hypothetical protein [Shewanella sp. UCD-KL12]|uniref:hypothetical protein n=1 Tax=Shewanella sp. UCD-KL12 TaxID=1917163 RepID=UPI000970F11C|nr:hypothetical protein [Shewanella sp. UCD-KL12]